MQSFRTRITTGGRIIIPAKIRKKLHLNIDDEVLLKIDGAMLSVFSLKAAIESAQGLVQKYSTNKTDSPEPDSKPRKDKHVSVRA